MVLVLIGLVVLSKCAQNGDFADLLSLWGDRASYLQLKGACMVCIMSQTPLISICKDNYSSSGKKSRWDVQEDEAAGVHDAMQENDEGEEEEELEEDEEIPLEDLPCEPVRENPRSKAVNPPSKAVNPTSKAVNPTSKAVNPSSEAVNPPSKAVNPASKAHSFASDRRPFHDDSRRSMTSLASSASLAATVIETPERLVNPIISKDGMLTPSPVSMNVVTKEVLLVVDSPLKVVKEEPRTSQEHADGQAPLPLFDREAALQELAMLEASLLRS